MQCGRREAECRYDSACVTGSSRNTGQLYGGGSYYFPADQIYDLQHGIVLYSADSDDGRAWKRTFEGVEIVLNVPEEAEEPL